MSLIIKEATRPYLEAQLNLIRQFSRQSPFEIHHNLCLAISEYLEFEFNKIRDQVHYTIFQQELLTVGELVSVLRKTVKQEPYWCLPLIQECYTRLGINYKNREILIAESKFHYSYEVRVNLVSQYKIADYYEKILKEKTNDQKSPKIIDVFTIPYEMKYDLASFALLGHEVAHVYFNQHTDRIKTKVREKFEGAKEYHINVASAHVEEYMCDQVARELFGPSFDFALLTFMCLKGGKGGTRIIDGLTHPAEGMRMQEALRSFENWESDSVPCKLAINDIIEKFFKGTPQQSYNWEIFRKNDFEDYTKFAFDLYTWLYPFVKPSLARQITSKELGTWWDLIVPVLNEMLPPIENVSEKYPIQFDPIQAQVISTLYYFYRDYRESNNEFFKGENKNNSNLFRTKLTALLRYAISIYDFVKYATNERNKSDRNAIEKLGIDSNTLWAKRKTLKVVPTTSIQKQYSAHGVDLRLGTTFITGKLSDLTHITQDILAAHKSSIVQPHYLERYFDYHTVPIGKPFTLHPHSFVLASTLEYVSIPEDYYALVLGRSSWGRLGLNIATATAIGSGFKGCITLELRNLGETPLQLKIGTRICQITLIPNPSSEAKQQYSLGANKYLYPIEAEIPNLEQDDDLPLLQKYNNLQIGIS